jgi:hypothetical protein
MNKTNYMIAVLTMSALILAAANYFAATPATADVVIKDRDYQVATASSQTGGDVVYVIDNRTGLLGVFAYDTNNRQLAPRVQRPVADAFLTRR